MFPKEARIRSACSGSSVDEPSRRWQTLARPRLSHVSATLPGAIAALPSSGRWQVGAVESLRLARCPRCQRLFAICSHCDRGHVYCGPSCSDGARRDSLRRARRRHRCSPEGRLDHRDRERERRRRRRLFRARVGDHPSTTPEPAIKLVPALAPSGTSTLETPASRGELLESPDAPRPLPVAASSPMEWDAHCRVCGRPGRWFRTAPDSHRGRGHPAASA